MKRFLQCVIISLAISLFTGCGRIPEPESRPGQDQRNERSAHAYYAAEWLNSDVPQTMIAGTQTTIYVNARNVGDWVWPNPPAANPSRRDGRYAVRLCYQWATADGQLFPRNSTRGDLKLSVAPGEVAEFAIDVEVPENRGSYELHLDLVEELVTFFSAKRSEKLIVPVSVQ